MEKNYLNSFFIKHNVSLESLQQLDLSEPAFYVVLAIDSKESQESPIFLISSKISNIKKGLAIA